MRLCPMTATLRKDFDDFLFAPVGNDSDGTPVTLLTVLARLGVDPWEEAAELAHLSREPAMQRLASRLEAMPNGPASAADTVTIATRLIALLHRVPTRSASKPEVPLQVKVLMQSKGINPAFYVLIGLIIMLVTQCALTTTHGPAAMDTTITVGTEK